MSSTDCFINLNIPVMPVLLDVKNMEILANIIISILFLCLTAVSFWRFLRRRYPEKWFHMTYSFAFLGVALGVWFCSILTVSSGILILLTFIIQYAWHSWGEYHPNATFTILHFFKS